MSSIVYIEECMACGVLSFFKEQLYGVTLPQGFDINKESFYVILTMALEFIFVRYSIISTSLLHHVDAMCHDKVLYHDRGGEF